MDPTPSPLPPAAGDDSRVTSLTLLGRVRANVPGAWETLVHLYSPLVFSWARRAGLADEDAADVVQEVWAAVAGHFGRFQKDAESGTFRGWLWTVTRNKLRDFARVRQNRPAGVGGTVAHGRLQEVPDAEYPDSEAGDGRAELLRRAVQLVRTDFEEHTFRAFWRMTVEGATAAEVAAELGLKVNAVYQAKARVLRRLREELGELLD